MNEEKQIEEMAKSMCRNYGTQVCASCDAHATCMIHLYAVDVYNADYRKQKEGHWIYVHERAAMDMEPYICSCCEGYSKTKSTFCHNCGAKMKGGEE